MSRKEVGIVLKAYDQASRQLTGVTSSLQRMKTQLLGMAAGYVGIRAIGRAISSVIREYASFEQGMARIHTMLDEGSSRYLPQYERQIDLMARQYGESAESLQNATYDILGASVDAGKAMSVLRANTIAAKGGFTSTATATKAAVGILNAYGLEAEKTGRIQDILAATVKRGVITYEELASSIGNVTSIAAVLGVDFESVTAAIATFTRAGIPAETSIMSLKNILTTFQSPTAEARKVAAELGFELDASSIKGRGLIEVMDKLKHANAAQLKVLMPNIRGLTGFAAGLNNAAGLGRDYQTMLESTGRSQEAFAKAAGTMQMAMDKTAEEWKSLKRDVGKEWRPFSMEFMKDLRDTLGLFNDLNDALKEYDQTKRGLTVTVPARGPAAAEPQTQRIWRPGPGAAGGYYETVPMPPSRGGFQGGQFKSYPLDLPATKLGNRDDFNAFADRWLANNLSPAVNMMDEAARRTLTPIGGDLTGGTAPGDDGASAAGEATKVTTDITAAYRRMANDMDRTSKRSWGVRRDLLIAEKDKYLEIVEDKALVLKWFHEQEEKQEIDRLKALGDLGDGFRAYAMEAERSFETLGERGYNIAAGWDSAFGSFFDNMRTDFNDMRALARSLADDLMSTLWHEAVTKPAVSGIMQGLGSLGGEEFPVYNAHAHGNVFGRSGIRMLGGGGVLSRPTLFADAAGGLNVAGEAGEEGFFPLTRIGGDLGVRGTAPKVTVQVINNGQPMRVRHRPPQWDGDTLVTAVILDDFDHEGPISERLRQGV